MGIIEVTDLKKEFRLKRRHKNAFRTFFDRKYDICKAVDGITFSVEPGEAVGFVGPNGAGKSTTIKMMTGILEPTAGTLRVLGRDPCKNRKENARHIGVVFGQRSQLWWDLPVADSFELLAKIYDVPEKKYREKIEMFKDVFAIDAFWNQPVRQLSLGQKMRAEFSASLLHSPEVIFLDEPTIGLDVVVKNEIRAFIRKIQAESNTTIILTTHDMRDMEEICDRLIMIDHGRLLIDDTVNAVKARYGSTLALEVMFVAPVSTLILPDGCCCQQVAANKWRIEFDHRQFTANDILNSITPQYPVNDMRVVAPDIEDIIRNLYTSKENTL